MFPFRRLHLFSSTYNQLILDWSEGLEGVEEECKCDVEDIPEHLFMMIIMMSMMVMIIEIMMVVVTQTKARQPQPHFLIAHLIFCDVLVLVTNGITNRAG